MILISLLGEYFGMILTFSSVHKNLFMQYNTLGTRGSFLPVVMAAGQHIFSQRLKPQSGDTTKTYRNPKTIHEKSPAARVIM